MKTFIKRHVEHDIRVCDCPPTLVLLVLHLYDVADWLAGLDWDALREAVSDVD